MTMIDGSASLQISSTTRTAASIAEALGIPATHMAEKGDLRLDIRGNPTRGPRPVYEYAAWSVTVDGDEATDDSSAGFTSLRTLVEQFSGKAQALGELRDTGEYEMYVSWHGTSGSSQGGFVLPLDLLTGFVELGCDLFGSVYSYEEPEIGESAPHRG